MTVLDSQIGGSSRYHCFTAAHIALHQTVHRRTLCKIGSNFPDGVILRTGQGKGQNVIKFVQICFLINRGNLSGPGGAHQGQTC